MPQNLLAIHGVIGLVVAVGEKGKIIHFSGDVYGAEEVGKLTLHDLRGVFVESRYSAWAVGDGGTVLHYDGTKWWPVATASRLEPLNAIWGDPADGLWIGGARQIINRHPGCGSIPYESDVEVRAIWGRGPDDLWLLCAGRLAMHWDGEGCHRIPLPGDLDEEWSAVAGTPGGSTFIVGVSGFMLHHDGRRWEELPTDTTELITGAVCTDSALYVTTDGGFVREYDGRRWRTVAFSAFGPLRSICVVDGVVWVCGDRGVVIQHRFDDEAGE